MGYNYTIEYFQRQKEISYQVTQRHGWLLNAYAKWKKQEKAPYCDCMIPNIGHSGKGKAIAVDEMAKTIVIAGGLRSEEEAWLVKCRGIFRVHLSKPTKL